MMNTLKALTKQFLGAKYESAKKSLLEALILFAAIHAAQFRIVIASSILYLISTLFTAGVMWQVLTGRRHMENIQGMFSLPFDNRSFVFSYVLVLGAHTLITKTLLIWALFFAAAAWNMREIVLAVFCGCMACTAAAAGYQMYRKGQAVFPLLWAFSILAAILTAHRWITILAAAAASFLAAVLYLFFADAYNFYFNTAGKKAILHAGHTGGIFVYLIRYLTANKSYLINTAGLWVAACFLPLLLGEFQGLNIFPIGLAILCLNTPICTLLSCDPDLEQALHMLPGQAVRFCWKYCLFVFTINGIASGIYLCSWQITNNKVGLIHVGMLLLFNLQSAIFSVLLEWKSPLRDWKTESDLWHHPRKYLIPLVMLLAAALVGAWPLALWIWAAILLAECCILFFFAHYMS